MASYSVAAAGATAATLVFAPRLQRIALRVPHGLPMAGAATVSALDGGVLVYYYFYRWQRLGLWQQLNTVVNALDRVAHGREPIPVLACIDSQSVKLAPRIYEHRGLNAHKLVNGRKRQILVDSGGRIWTAHVHAAHRHDSTGALALLPHRPWWARRLQLVLTDAAYRGRFARHLLGLGLVQQISSRPPTQRGFVPLARRWVVERTVAWLTCFRRVVVD